MRVDPHPKKIYATPIALVMGKSRTILGRKPAK
jgi:hypothetical protein